MALHKLRLITLKTFGQFPNTEEIEAKDKALRAEYDQFISFGKSAEYAHFVELEKFVQSGEPLRVKNELKQMKYSGSEEQLKETEFKRLSKDKELKNYLRIYDSPDLQTIRAIELSGKPVRYKEFKDVVESTAYKANRKLHKKNNSDEYQKELAFKELSKDAEIKLYVNAMGKRIFKDYFKLEGSEKVNKYNELKEYMLSNEFIDRKTYLQSNKKYEQSAEYAKEQEYNELTKSERIVWYKSLENSKKFDDIKRWELVFSDDFNSAKLDREKWMTRYFWGEALIQKNYSLASDRHYYTDDKNIEFENSLLKISTRQEQAEGLAWDLKMGFIPKKFDYTSGLISTGESFRQKYGRIEAKVRFSKTPGVYHAFWLVGEKMLPHIDIFRKNAKNTTSQGSVFSPADGAAKPLTGKSKLGGFNFDTNFFILSIDWSPEKIIWKINGVPYMESTKNIPNTEMYLVFSSGVTGKEQPEQLPATFEIDWVRCWKESSENQE